VRLRGVWFPALIILIALVGGTLAARRLLESGAAPGLCGPTAAHWQGRVTGRAIGPTRPASERRVRSLVNDFRVSRGLAPLALDSRLVLAARYQSSDQLAKHYFAHERVGLSFTRRFARYSPSSCIAENLGRGYATPAGVVEAWKRSPGHRHVMLLPWVKRAGVGWVGEYVTLDVSS
jgi:uncharacterized protein YkwD